MHDVIADCGSVVQRRYAADRLRMNHSDALRKILADVSPGILKTPMQLSTNPEDGRS